MAGLKPNELGLYDMSGNLEEWCWDWYDEFGTEALVNPKDSDTGTERIKRGEDVRSDAESCELTRRGKSSPHWYIGLQGLRLALSCNV